MSITDFVLFAGHAEGAAMNIGSLNARDLRLLAAIGRADGPLLCDRGEVESLLTHGLIERTDLGWTISPKGRMRLHMHR